MEKKIVKKKKLKKKREKFKKKIIKIFLQLFSLLEKLIFRYISNQRFFVMSFWYNDEKMIDVIVDTKWRVSFSNKTKFQSIKLETFDKIKIIWTQLDNIDIIGQYWHNETISTKLDNMDIINYRNKNRNLWFFFSLEKNNKTVKKSSKYWLHSSDFFNQK